jgi:Zinc carboxypeptidase
VFSFDRSKVMKGVSIVIGIAVALLLAATVLPAAATPVCPDDDKSLCGGRVFAEADGTIDFVQHDSGEYEDGIKALEREHPNFVRVRKFSKVLDDKKAVSYGEREMWLVEITDFRVPERGKVPIAVSLSVHGPERAGLEGGARYMEDLATWADEDPTHKLMNGTKKDSVKVSVQQALRKVHLYFAVINPDGWAAGDNANGNNYVRGNDNGVDLNREFPTMGWTERDYTPISEPESKAWHKFLKRIDPKVATDIHGELTSANNAFADLMLPAGQWNPRRQAREAALAKHMKSNVERFFELDGVVIQDIVGFSGQKPAEFATGYDVVGYDDSGFMGDYFTQRFGALEMDVEHFFSHMAPGGNWVPSLEQAHIAAVRGEIETLIVEGLVTKRINPSPNLGMAGYLFDPKVVKSKDGYGGPPPPDGYDPQSYRATRMKYFKDLSRFAQRPLRKVLPGDVREDGLKGLDTFVISGRLFPKDPRGRKPAPGETTKALERFVKKGGNLVLTDRALRMLVRLGIVKKEDVGVQRYVAGHVDVEDFADPYAKKVHHTASQTYYEVPLGYPADADASPHWTVAREAWEGAGGKTVAYITDEARVGLGHVEFGKGTVGILGAVLPNPIEKYDHFYGLADYGVTVAGGQILNNMIKFGKPAPPEPEPEPDEG